MLISAYRYESPRGCEAGQAYLFDLRGNLQYVFQPPKETQGIHFGLSAAVSNEKILISAPRHNLGYHARAGQVYLFDSAGNYLHNFWSPDGIQEFGKFGWSVAIAGEVVLIGAPVHNVATFPLAGQAYFFDLYGKHLYTLQAPDMQKGARFGSSVNITGNNILIGADTHDIDNYQRAGKVYMFDFEGNHLHTLRAPDGPRKNARFGASIITVGNSDKILIGAPEHNIGHDKNAGQAYLFDLEGNHLHTFRPPDGDNIAGARFGSSGAAVGEEKVLIGALGKTVDGHRGAGKAYLFKLPQ